MLLNCFSVCVPSIDACVFVQNETHISKTVFIPQADVNFCCSRLCDIKFCRFLAGSCYFEKTPMQNNMQNKLFYLMMFGFIPATRTADQASCAASTSCSESLLSKHRVLGRACSICCFFVCLFCFFTTTLHTLLMVVVLG